MTRLLPLVWVITFAAIGFGWRSWLHYRRFGHSGVLLFRSGRWPQHLREALLILLSLLIISQAVAYAVGADWLASIELATPPAGGVFVILGVALLLAGIALMVVAQLDLGASWRVGIDERARPGLVTTGIYRFSRNPIYLALFVTLAGLLVLLPTWLTLAILLAGVVGIRSAVHEEECYLRRAYGNAFDAYASRVGRFVPGLGTIAN